MDQNMTQTIDFLGLHANMFSKWKALALHARGNMGIDTHFSNLYDYKVKDWRPFSYYLNSITINPLEMILE